MKPMAIAAGILLAGALIMLLFRSLNSAEEDPLFTPANVDSLMDESVGDDEVRRDAQSKRSEVEPPIDHDVAPNELPDGDSPPLGQQSIHVRVSDGSGQPVPGCAVFLMSAENDDNQQSFHFMGLFRHVFRDQKPQAQIESGADGRAGFFGLATGSFKVAVFKDGYAATFSDVVRVVKGIRLPLVEMQLAPGGTVSGIVVTESGDPIEGAEVACVVEADEYRGTVPTLNQVTGPDGRFRFATLSDEKNLVFVRAKGFARGGANDIDLGDEDIRITLSAGGSVVAHVFDEATGAGIDDAELVIWDQPWLSHGVAQGGGLYLFSGIPRVQGVSIHVAAPSHSFSAALGEPGWLGEASFARMVEPGEETRIEIPMVALGSVQGRVADRQTGVGLEGASVTVFSGDGDHARVSKASTGADGSYRVSGVAGGSVLVQVRCAKYQTVLLGQRAGHERPGGGAWKLEAVVGEVTLAPLIEVSAGRIVRGRCVDSRGNPVEGASVSCSSQSSGDSFIDRMVGAGQVTTASGPNGVFELTGLSLAMAFEVRAAHPSFPAGGGTTVAAEGESELTVILMRGASIQGRLLGDDGTPIAQMAVMRSPGGESVVTDSRGGFVMGAVPEGEVVLSLGEATRARLDPDGATINVLDGETVRVTLHLESMPSIRGKVVDEGGLPIAGAGVRIASGNEAGVVTDSNGEFVMRYLKQGRYTLFAWRDGYRSAQMSGVDAPTQTVEITLRLND